ncbi:hypothetical protein A0O36_01242 [Piscirickettsiaceae bacterium NZ-RLO1]|nr:hypothetical protein A0O36_01242 [Piscirickettsiaceae bacterium NZ-RLO1]
MSIAFSAAINVFLTMKSINSVNLARQLAVESLAFHSSYLQCQHGLKLMSILHRKNLTANALFVLSHQQNL